MTRIKRAAKAAGITVGVALAFTAASITPSFASNGKPKYEPCYIQCSAVALNAYNACLAAGADGCWQLFHSTYRACYQACEAGQ
jgi:hypothetical protein